MQWQQCRLRRTRFQVDSENLCSINQHKVSNMHAPSSSANLDILNSLLHALFPIYSEFLVYKHCASQVSGPSFVLIFNGHVVCG